MGVKKKFVFPMFGVLLLLGLLTTLFIYIVQIRTQTAVLRQKGVTVTRGLVGGVMERMLKDDIVGLLRLIKDVKAVDEDISYIYVLDQEVAVVVHTFEQGFPVELKKINPPAADQVYSAWLLETDEGYVRDIAVPINGLGALHIGMSENRIRQAVALTIWILLGMIVVGMVIGTVVITFITTRVLRPLVSLTRGAEEIGGGNLDYRIKVDTHDEVGLLASAFNKMVGDLQESFRQLGEEISERQRAELALQEAKEELEVQNEELLMLDKIKDGLIRDVTHELKTPVAKQAMQVDLLTRIINKHNLTEECHKIIKTMESAIKRQESVIHNILDLSRLGTGGRKYSLEKLRLDHLLEDVLQDYQSTLDAHHISVNKKLSPVTTMSDQDMLFHVFSNLINNAIKYRSHSRSPQLNVFLEDGESAIVIKVEDNGVGLSETECPKVFNRFYQASASAEGSGVGLTIAKIIVEDLSGQIWLESVGLDQGVTAVVTFPNQSKEI